jgi:mRNA interferase MazF
MKDDYPKRGDVYWVRLDPTDGKEINKTRPCLIISSDIANRSELIIVAPITSNVERVFSKIEVKINLDGKPGKVIPRQMRSIDRTKRLTKKIGTLSLEEMGLVDDAIRLILDLI